MKTALVTGASGALGRAVTARLLKNGHYRVVAASRHANGDGGIRLDVRNQEMFAAAIDRSAPDLVVHLAASFTDNFDDSYDVNVKAASNLLNAIKISGMRVRVLLAGSAAEYGVVRPEENPIREDRVLSPVSTYGLTKAWQTQLAGYHAGHGVDVLVARLFNLDGPGMSERLFIGRLQKQIEEVLAGGRSVIELGPLSAVRDYVSTDEAASQVCAIALNGKSGRVYHVASGKPVRMRDILAKYLAFHGLDASIVREAEALSNRVGYDVPEIYANISNTLQLMRA